jgi:hypothetical protein
MSSFRSFSALVVFLAVSATTARTDVPYPTCEDAGCTNPADFGSYLRLREGQLPNDFHPSWKYLPRTRLDHRVQRRRR